MAGAGYKLFNTGDVLTAAQVNTYLMEQTVMVFADAAARTTALTGVVSEGMISYLKDTNAVEVYNGSAWVASDDPNAIQNTIVDAKGDLITATAADTPARLAVGSNGDTLVADSAASTGLRWQSNFPAGKNKIINGDFNIWQRGTTFNSIANGAYCTDRFLTIVAGTGASMNITRQAFSAGAPFSTNTNYSVEPNFFLQVATTSGADAGSLLVVSQRIEDRRTLAGNTVTVSFWAKATSGTPKIGVNMEQGNIGRLTGQAVTISTTWNRYSVNFTLPATTSTSSTDNWVSAELFFSAGSTFNSISGSIGLQSATFQVWGLQVEQGNVATAFQTATGTLQGELAAAMRYFYRISSQSTGHRIGNGFNSSTTRSIVPLYFPVAFRGSPSVTASNVTDFTLQHGATPTNTNASAIGFGNVTGSMLDITVDVASGLTIGALSQLRAANGTGFIDFSAEL
jgi:hypothetical protein